MILLVLHIHIDVFYLESIPMLNRSGKTSVLLTSNNGGSPHGVQMRINAHPPDPDLRRPF